MKKKKTYGLALQDRKNVECCFASSSSSCFVFFFLGLLFCFGRQRTSYDRALVNYIRIEEKKNIRNKLLIYVYSYRLWWALVARWVSSSSSWYVSYLEGSPVRTHVYRTLANVILYYLLSSIADSNCWNWVRLVHSALANASQQQNPTLLISIFFCVVVT